MLSLPPGTTLGILGVIIAIVAIFISRRLCGRKSTGLSGTINKSKDTIVIAGPVGAGKTSLAYKLLKGAVPTTVSSLKVGVLKGKIEAEAQQVITVVDVPGHAQLRKDLISRASTAGGLIFVVDSSAVHDATSKQDHFEAASDMLYDLFTTPAIVDAARPLLVVCNKADARGHKSVEEVRTILETLLERKKTTRPTVAASGDDGTEAGPGSLLLGEAGSHFRFAAHAPCPVEWCSVSVTADGAESVAPVASFITEALAQ